MKRMMETASFVMPSPKTREKSLGCLSGLMRETAAMTSVEQSKLHMRMISSVVRSSGVTSPVSPFFCVNGRLVKSLYKTVIPLKLMKAIIVPISPKRTMFLMLAKNFFLYMLKPLANTIGGRQK